MNRHIGRDPHDQPEPVSESFSRYLDYERSASRLLNFEPNVFPGLLQLPEYAHVVLQAVSSDADIEAREALRLRRQESLLHAGRPDLHFLVDESVIRRPVGGREVMRRQFGHVLELAEEPHVTFGVVPFTYGWHLPLRAGHVLLEFEAPEREDVLYVENAYSESIIAQSSAPQAGALTPLTFQKSFAALNKVASIELLRSAWADLGS